MRKRVEREPVTLLGEGDDHIEPNSWHPPISDYPQIIKIYAACAAMEFEFPFLQLEKHLDVAKVFSNSFSDRSKDGIEYFFEELLAPYFYLDSEPWGGDAPGRSGVYIKAYLKNRNLHLVNQILKETEECLSRWCESAKFKKEFPHWPIY